MKRLLLAMSVVAIAFLPLVGCRSIAAEGTPPELQAVPTSQSVALEVAIEKIEANDPQWVNADGSIKRDALLPILKADKAAWDELDRFYNGGE